MMMNMSWVNKVQPFFFAEAASTSTVDDDYSKLLDDFSQILERVVRIQPKQVRTELEEKMIRKIKENGCSGDWKLRVQGLLLWSNKISCC